MGDGGITYYEGVVQEPALQDVAALKKRARLTSKPPAGTLLVMVGLPARGKSFISAKIYSFVRWTGQKIKVFNVGSYRRKETSDDTERSANSGASFFDDKNVAASRKREDLAMTVLGEALDWLAAEHEGVAIFDATNTTRERRESISRKCDSRQTSPRVIFVESICDDARVLEQNMRAKVRASPDFKGMRFDDALRDLKTRLAHYESRYVPVADDEGAYIKSYNFSSKVTSHLCFGRMSKTILPFLVALHTDDRPVYLFALPPTAQEPETLFKKQLKRNASAASLTSSSSSLNLEADVGERLSTFWWSKLRTLCQLQTESRVLVLSSTMPQAVAAAEKVRDDKPHLVTLVHTSALNPLLLTSTHPYVASPSAAADSDDDEEDHRRSSFYDRGDGGESFADLVQRLETVVMDLEASVDPVLVVCHATPARALRAYFKNIDVFDISTGLGGDPATKALADAAPAVLEVRQSMSGAYDEIIHWI